MHCIVNDLTNTFDSLVAISEKVLKSLTVN